MKIETIYISDELYYRASYEHSISADKKIEYAAIGLTEKEARKYLKQMLKGVGIKINETSL